MILDLGVNDTIIGTVKEDSYPSKIKVGHFNNVNIEQIVKLKPDYIFCATISQEKIYQKLRKFDLNIIQISILSINDLKENYLKIGNIFQIEEHAKEISKRIDSIIKSFKPLEQTYMGIIWYSPIITFGENTFQGDLLKQFGLKNSMGNVRKWFTMTSKEKIVKKDPQIFFIFMKKGHRIKKKIMKSKTFKNLSFVKQDRIIIIEYYDDFLQPSLRSIVFLQKLYDRLKK